MNASMRKICIFTSTRAEYGLLSNLVRRLAASPDADLKLIVSGTHLAESFGMTITEIEADAFAPIGARVELPLSDNSPLGVCKAMASAMAGYGEALIGLNPDLLVVLGDRYETLCAAAAAQICCVPIAHISGGETTAGAVDEAFRHAITKMSHLHFPSCEEHRRRIIQLGEAPERVFNVGALGVENSRSIALLGREELSCALGFPVTDPYFLVTLHPVTLERSSPEALCRGLFSALDAFPDHRVVFTYANADPGGQIVNRLIRDYVRSREDRCVAFASMGMVRYLSAMRYTSAVIGNSSSGIIEAPSFRVPTVDIGDRQMGRVRASTVLHAEAEPGSITAAIRKALDAVFRTSVQNASNPYDQPNTSARIADIVLSHELDHLLKKTFWQPGLEANEHD